MTGGLKKGGRVRKVVSPVLLAAAVGAAAVALGGGVAVADEVSVRGVPGVGAGSLLDPTIGLPTSELAPLDGLLTYLAG